MKTRWPKTLDVICAYCHAEITVCGNEPRSGNYPYSELVAAGWILMPHIGPTEWICKDCVERNPLYKRGYEAGYAKGLNANNPQIDMEEVEKSREVLRELRAVGVKPRGYRLAPIGGGKRVTIVSDPELNLKE